MQQREHGSSRHETQGKPEQVVPSPRRRWPVYALILVLALALVMDLVFYTGFYASDDRQYIRGAWQLAESGRLSYISMGTVRLMLVVPLALVARLTDRNLFLMAASIVAFHLLVIVGTYWVGRLIHGLYTGLMAAGFIAICPLAVLFATMIVPDHHVTALSLLAAGCVLAASTRLTEYPRQVRSAGALCASGGFLFALACGAKITAIVLAPVFAVLILSWARAVPFRLVLRAGLLFVVGTALAALLLWMLFYRVTGLYSPLQDRHMASRVSSVPERVAAKPYDSPGGRFARLVGFAMNKGNFGLPTVAALLVLVGYPLTRGRSWGLYCAFIWVCAYMTWGTFSLSRYLPPPMQIRYFILALPALMIMLAYVVVVSARWLWRRFGADPLGRRALKAAAALGCLLATAGCCMMLNRLAGKSYYAVEVAGTRHALVFAEGLDRNPVVASYWLSDRVRPLLQAGRWSHVRTSTAKTSLADVRDYLQTGFLYLDCETEHTARRGAREPSPLDIAVQDALVGSDDTLRARTIGSFTQFETRFAALRQVLNKSERPPTGAPDGGQVFVREVFGVQPQAGSPRADP